jgi:digeranylgeranylglycerophospholipid reductase
MIECDVLVVGAGPAGSSAARAAALSGAKTIFIDKKREVGVPVQCAEGIGEYLFPYLPFKIPKHLLVWKIDGISFWAEDITIERTGSNWSGYSINRDEFDKWLADKATKAGAKLMLETELIDLEVKGDYNVTKAIVKTPKGNKEIVPKVVIAADGVDSTVLKLLGFNLDLEKNAGYVIGFKMKNLKLEKPNHYQIYLGDFAPGAYAYIFPKSNTSANIGVGAIFFEKRLEECYEEFVNLPLIKKQIARGTIVEDRSGWAPIRYGIDKLNYGNVLLTGDVANQNFKPFIEGILPAIICGDLAGVVSSNFILKGEPLSNYTTYMENKLGNFFTESDRLIDTLYWLGKFPDKRGHLLRLGIFSNIFSLEQIHNLVNEDYTSLKSYLNDWDHNRKQF